MKYNVYQDQHSGGWVREILATGEWIRVGVYGTRESAINGFRGDKKALREHHYETQYPFSIDTIGL